MRIWDILEIEATEDRASVRRAYAQRLKLTNPEDDPEAFQALRTAYERALQWTVDDDRRSLFPDWREDDDTLSPAPDPEQEALPEDPAWAAFHDLRRLLNAGSSPDPQTVLAGWTALTEAMDAAPLAMSGELEPAIADLILRFEPRSDVLILSAIRYFNWDGMVRFDDARWVVEEVMEREADPAFRLGMEANEHRLSDAYWLLRRKRSWWLKPYDWLSPGLMRNMQEIFSLFDTARPDLLDELNPKTQSWWRWRLAHSFPGPLLILTLLVSAILLAPTILAPGSMWAAAGQYAAGGCAVLAAVGALPAYLQRRLLKSARRKLRPLAARRGIVLSVAGLVMAFALLLVASLAPVTPTNTALLALLTLVPLSATALLGRPDRRSGIYDRPIENVFRIDLLFMWVALIYSNLAGPEVRQMAAPWLAAVLCSSLAGDSLSEGLVRRPPRWAVVMSGLFLALIALASPVVVLIELDKILPAWVVAAVTIMMLTHNLFAAEVDKINRRVRLLISLPGACLLIPGAQALVVILMILLIPLSTGLTLFFGAIGQFGRKEPRRQNLPRG